MPRALDGLEPQIADSAYVDPAAVVIGDVVLRAEASVWPNATLRGDHGRIVVGEGSNVQDSAVLHEDAALGPSVTVGHSAIVHAATAAEGALVGMNAVVLDDAEIGERAVVGAGSVVTEGTVVPSGKLAVGTPAEVVGDAGDPTGAAGRYRDLAARYDRQQRE